MNKQVILLCTTLMVTLVLHTNLMQTSYAETCEDIKGEKKMPGKNHDDNNPSESKFMDMVFGKATICEVAYCYDNDECKGELDSDDHSEFKTTFVYEGSSDDQQDCLDYRYHL